MSTGAGRPYPGPRPFLQADQGRFFGRKAQAIGLAELWRSNRLVIAAGAAASGKTSLLNAGVFPLVADERADVLPLGRLSYDETFPFAAVPEHNHYTFALLRSWSPEEGADRLVGRTVRDFVRSRADRHGSPILAAVDQFEELGDTRGPRSASRQMFLAELAEALDDEPRLHLLLVVREEAAEMVSEPLGGGARHHVTSLSAHDAVEAVTGPVANIPRRYDEGVAEAIVKDLQTSRIIPQDGGRDRYAIEERVEPALLQVVCAHLWDSLPPEVNLITRREMRRYADTDAALTKYCGQVIAAVAEDHDLPVSRLRSWLQSTFITELGTRDTAYESGTATAGVANATVRALEDRHLLTAEWRLNARWYKLLSDRLIDPLRHAGDERPPLIEPAERLRAAGRALTLGELDLAERYALESIHDAYDKDLRHRAQADSLLGNLAYLREKPKEAEERHRTAANLYEALRDTNAVVRQLAAVGQALVAQGEVVSAVDYFRAALNRVPNDPIVQTQLALALWQLGESQGAVAVLNSVLENDGGNVTALRARGEILADLGDGHAAKRDLDRVMTHAPPSTLAAHGLALAELGDLEAARREIEKAKDIAQRNGLVLLFAARVSALDGDSTHARNLAQQAVNAVDPELSPQHREAARKLGQCAEARLTCHW